jgi:hypothetical protein
LTRLLKTWVVSNFSRTDRVGVVKPFYKHGALTRAPRNMMLFVSPRLRYWAPLILLVDANRVTFVGPGVQVCYRNDPVSGHRRNCLKAGKK